MRKPFYIIVLIIVGTMCGLGSGAIDHSRAGATTMPSTSPTNGRELEIDEVLKIALVAATEQIKEKLVYKSFERQDSYWVLSGRAKGTDQENVRDTNIYVYDNGDVRVSRDK